MNAPTIRPKIVPPNQFVLGGQVAWYHDEGHHYGYFHTYDRLQVAGANDAPRKVHVFLPVDYEERKQHYPVVYMNDGDTAFFPGGLAHKSWQVAETLSNLLANKAIIPVIVVAVCPLDRDREYTHTFWAPNRHYGGLAGYTAYLTNCVKPFIDANYRTIPDAAATAIVGSSHSGLAAFYIAATQPQAFGKAAALSPSFWIGLDLQLISSSLRDSLLLAATHSTLANPAQRPRLWIDWGLERAGGFHNSVIEALATQRGHEMVQLLQSDYGYRLGQDLLQFEDPMGQHNEDAWARRFGLVMKSFYNSTL